MKSYLEHANISVTDLEAGILFFQTAFPEFKIRHREEKWVHFGTEESYLALQTFEGEEKGMRNLYHSKGVNHLGFVVEDVAALGERLEKAGYRRSYPAMLQEYRRREYFFDKEGNEFEFVQYFSDKLEERNDYSE